MQRRWGRVGLLALAALAAVVACGRARGADSEAVTRIQDVIYGRKYGMALTMDVFKPAKQNGVGVLWMVSGGWFSSHEAVNPGFTKAFTDRGQTVFAIVHGSSPKFTIPEIVQDIDRATRFIRYHAHDYGIEPDRLGITGGSSGGHLSLMQGARGHDGDPKAADPVDRTSSKLQAVACFFPPTDLLNYGKPEVNALTLTMLTPFYPAFGVKSSDFPELVRAAREDSPITYVTKDMPPTLIIHGDADTLVPIQQSQLLMDKLEALHVPHQLVTRPGKGHGWPTLGEDLPIISEWIDRYAGPHSAAQ